MGIGKRHFNSGIRGSVQLLNKWRRDPAESNALGHLTLPFPLMDGIQALGKTDHVALRVTNFEIALAPFGIHWGARVQSLCLEVLVQRIDASYPKDHTRPTVARALRSMAQID